MKIRYRWELLHRNDSREGEIFILVRRPKIKYTRWNEVARFGMPDLDPEEHVEILVRSLHRGIVAGINRQIRKLGSKGLHWSTFRAIEIDLARQEAIRKMNELNKSEIEMERSKIKTGDSGK